MAKIQQVTLKLKLSNNGKKKIVNKDTIKHMSLDALLYINDTLNDLNNKENIMVNYPKVADCNTAIVSLLGDIQDIRKAIEKQISHIKAGKLNFNRSLGWKY